MLAKPHIYASTNVSRILVSNIVSQIRFGNCSFGLRHTTRTEANTSRRRLQRREARAGTQTTSPTLARRGHDADHHDGPQPRRRKREERQPHAPQSPCVNRPQLQPTPPSTLLSRSRSRSQSPVRISIRAMETGFPPVRLDLASASSLATGQPPPTVDCLVDALVHDSTVWSTCWYRTPGALSQHRSAVSSKPTIQELHGRHLTLPLRPTRSSAPKPYGRKCKTSSVEPTNASAGTWMSTLGVTSYSSCYNLPSESLAVAIQTSTWRSITSSRGPWTPPSCRKYVSTMAASCGMWTKEPTLQLASIR